MLRAKIRLSLVISVLLVLLATSTGQSIVILQGNPTQQEQIRAWLEESLETDIFLGVNGTILVGVGGNASADRLYDMAVDVANTCTLRCVQNDPAVDFGRWNSRDAQRRTTGVQDIDVGDLEQVQHDDNTLGVTPDQIIMHEIAEVYSGVRDDYPYSIAHAVGGIDAEDELMGEHGADRVGQRLKPLGGGEYMNKIRTENGTYIVVIFDFSRPVPSVGFYTELVPCNSAKGLIAIPSRSAGIDLAVYSNDGDHAVSGSMDEAAVPTDVTRDSDGHFYAAEDFVNPEHDRIHIYDPTGETLLDTIVRPEMQQPTGIAIDHLSGHFYLAVEGRIVRYDENWDYFGSYGIGDPSIFRPTDVEYWDPRLTQLQCHPDSIPCGIYATCDVTGQVYHFDPELDLNTETYRQAFGAQYLATPQGLDISPYGEVWVASTGNGYIYRFDLETGEPIELFDEAWFVNDPDREFTDVCWVDGDGLFAVDAFAGRGASIIQYDAFGNPIYQFGEGVLTTPRHIEIDFIADQANLVPYDPSTDVPPGLPSLVLTAYPNPFNPAVTFVWRAPAAGRLQLSVYDLRGELVCVLVDESVAQGEGRAVWDGRDGGGRAVASGNYLYEARLNGQIAVGSVALVR